MAESLTYNSLITDIQTYAERSDSGFIAQIPRFIMLAENRIASEVHGLGLLKFGDFQLNQSNPTFAKPARWRETSFLYIIINGEIQFLKGRGLTFCRTYWPDQTQEGVPEYYCDYSYEHTLVAATPDQDYSAQIAYHERPIPLDITNQTNWTTQYAPQLILYASLLEAQPWLKLDERVATFQSMFDRASAAVTQEATRRVNGDDALQRNVG